METLMLKDRILSIFLTFFFCSNLALAQESLDSEVLFSPSVGRIFYEIAYEQGNFEDRSASDNRQTILFLNAAINLDKRAGYLLPCTIRFASRLTAAPDAASEQNYSELVYNALVKYVDSSSDLEVVRLAVGYLLEQSDSREEREKLLEQMLKNFGPKNAFLESDLAALLGLLAAEKPDIETAALYFASAFNSNNHNKLAFEKLTELMPEQIQPAIYIEYLRLVLRENPLELEAALAFADYAQRLQLYETAADSFKYCADLFTFLYPSEALPAYIYLPWVRSNYNTQRNQHKSLQIAEQIRQSGTFDLLLEAIAGKAALKIGDEDQAARIFKDAQEKAKTIWQSASERPEPEIASELAWFYCFVLPDASQAIDWANKAYSIEPNWPTAAALLAYALVINGQPEWAGQIIERYQNNQISDIALARIQLAQEQKSSAFDTLKSAISSEPGTLAAETARAILTKHGADYIPPVDPDIILTALKNNLGQNVVPEFVSPEKIISARLNLHGSKFSYGSKFDASVAVTNNSSEPLIIGDDGLFKGNIRIDADVTGDINRQIPNLVSLKIRPSSLVEPQRSILIPVHLETAELKQLLFSYPQASLDIAFTLFIDPVTTPDGRLTNRLAYIEPAQTIIKRPGIELTAKYLQNRINSLPRAKQGQKIKTAQLFIGLLAEQHAMANREPLYKFKYADGMPELLKSALVHNLTDNDWVVKVHTMSGMLSLPLDFELISAVAQNLNDDHWPARLIALYLLAKNQGGNFDKVLNWTAERDSSGLVRNMAIALGATIHTPQQQEQPPADNLDKSPAG